MANYRYLDLEGLSKYNELLKTWVSNNFSEGGHNHDSVYKKKQNAVGDPTASGTTNQFIDTISQDTQGVIKATKKTLSAATASAVGGIKVSSVNTSAVTVNSESTTAGRYYPVELNNDSKAIVNIPWTDVNVANNTTTSKYFLTGSTNSEDTTGELVKRSTVYVDADGHLYDDSKKVATENYVNTYVADEIGKGFAANDAMVFKGTLGTGGTITVLPTSGYSAGWTYKVITAGTYAGVSCGIGDMVICVKDGPTTGTSIINGDWSVVQSQLDLVGGKDTVGFVKNGSTVTSTSGLTACPIISGVPYYKDTNTTSFTITAYANDDDVVILSGSNGSNAVTYTANHATQGPSTTKDTTITPAIADNGSTDPGSAITPSHGEYVKLDIPSFTVNKYGHVSAAANKTLSFKLPAQYSLPLAANGTRGGIQIGYNTSGKNYAVQLSSEKAYVNVPWTDTKVTQSVTALSSTATTYPLIFTKTANATADVTEGVRFASGVSLTLKTGDVTLNGVHKIAELDSTVTLSPATTRPTEFASGDIGAISSIVQTDGKISTGTSGNIMYRITDDEIAALFN